MNNTLFSATFRLNSKILALLYICWYYKYSMSIFITMYEMFKDMSLFALKAMSVDKKIKLTDNTFIKIMQESSKLYLQILKGVSVNDKIKKLTLHNPDNEVIPDRPKINLDEFSEDYKRFIVEYLLENIPDIYAEYVKLPFGSEDLYLGALNAK